MQLIQPVHAKALRCSVRGVSWKVKARGPEVLESPGDMAGPEIGSLTCHLRAVKPEDFNQEEDRNQTCALNRSHCAVPG